MDPYDNRVLPRVDARTPADGPSRAAIGGRRAPWDSASDEPSQAVVRAPARRDRLSVDGLRVLCPSHMVLHAAAHLVSRRRNCRCNSRPGGSRSIVADIRRRPRVLGGSRDRGDCSQPNETRLLRCSIRPRPVRNADPGRGRNGFQKMGASNAAPAADGSARNAQRGHRRSQGVVHLGSCLVRSRALVTNATGAGNPPPCKKSVPAEPDESENVIVGGILRDSFSGLSRISCN